MISRGAASRSPEAAAIANDAGLKLLVSHRVAGVVNIPGQGVTGCYLRRGRREWL